MLRTVKEGAIVGGHESDVKPGSQDSVQGQQTVLVVMALSQSASVMEAALRSSIPQDAKPRLLLLVPAESSTNRWGRVKDLLQGACSQDRGDQSEELQRAAEEIQDENVRKVVKSYLELRRTFSNVWRQCHDVNDLYDIDSRDPLEISSRILERLGRDRALENYDMIVFNISSGLRGVTTAMIFAALALAAYVKYSQKGRDEESAHKVMLVLENCPERGGTYSCESPIQLRSSVAPLALASLGELLGNELFLSVVKVLSDVAGGRLEEYVNDHCPGNRRRRKAQGAEVCREAIIEAVKKVYGSDRLSENTIDKYLRKLKSLGLVNNEKVGKEMWYSLTAEGVGIASILEALGAFEKLGGRGAHRAPD